MRFLFFLAFGLFILESIARPQQSIENESEMGRSEYDGNGESAEDYLSDKSAEELNVPDLNRENTINSRKNGFQESEENMHSNINSYAHLPQSKQYDNLEGHETAYRKSSIIDSSINQEEQLAHQQLNQNLNRDEIEEEEEDISQSPIANHNKRNNENSVQKSEETNLGSNEEDNTFYEDDRRFINDKSEYNNDPVEATKQQQILKHGRDSRRDVILKRKPDNLFLVNRDRRQASLEHHDKVMAEDTKTSDKKNEVEYTGEDNESAIKRNIKKLSREELEDLFNSLSDDKKALLKKIIDNKLEGVNKREITKKAGAVEENSCIESGQTDLSKIDSGRSLDPSPSVSSSDTTETTKQTEINEVSSSKNSEAENGSAKSDSKDELTDENLQNVKEETVKNNVESNGESKNEQNNQNIQELTKNENKRETNSDDMPDGKSDVSNDEISGETQYALGNEMDCSKDDSWSELTKDESELQNAYSNLYKRDADAYAKTANIKSLEESFPNYEFVDLKNSDSKLTPLIRVKRTNSKVVKRGTDHCVNMKVPFFPIALDDGLDDTEKSEFDDGGIFERASNYEKIGKRNRHIKTDLDSINHNQHLISKQYPTKSQAEYSKISSESDSANIGSDTDNILSNVEGVEENLMYNNGFRKKRISDDSKLNDEIVSIDNNDLISKLPLVNTVSDKDELVQNFYNYRESDAFGPIPPSSEGELGRFKRIRRLKPAPTLRSNI